MAEVSHSVVVGGSTEAKGRDMMRHAVAHPPNRGWLMRNVTRRGPRLLLAAGWCLLRLSCTRALAVSTCAGDCDGNGEVTVDDILLLVNIALGGAPITACAGVDGPVTVTEILQAVNGALDGCVVPAPTDTATATPAPPATPTQTPPFQCTAAAVSFNATFDAIQTLLFDAHGCTQQACHGSAAQGGLQLTAGLAYGDLVGVASSESPLKRVEPGDKTRSFLWQKLAASTDPSQLPLGTQVAGAPMPNGLPPLSKDELQALALWINAGAPQTGTVAGTEALLDACLPPPQPIIITPLDPPAPGTGVQFVMPPWHLEAHSEHEICFATYYDLTAQVPPEFQDPTGTLFRFSTEELRQDPQSHHLILNRYVGSADDIHDPSFGQWTCNGGEHAGQVCEPADLSACGAGTCMSQVQQSFACLGFGPFQGGGASFYAIGGAQKAQDYTEFVDGVFAQIPMKGILFWNSHAFNLTDEDTTMHARLNYLFAKDQSYPVQGIFDISKIFAAHTPPFQTSTVCNDYILPQGARLFSLSSHTHRHGKHFTVDAPDGTRVYESFIYNDPVTARYDPPLVFDSADATHRTLHYCSLYNNGVAADGSPDIVAVTRYSRLPASARNSIGLCTPDACVAGKLGAKCNGAGNDRACDSQPGAGDGWCDACPITGGESTENEMFILIGQYYLPGDSTGSTSPLLSTRSAPTRSRSSAVAVPPQIGCGSNHAGHVHHAP
jgi:hypothetical protein